MSEKSGNSSGQATRWFIRDASGERGPYESAELRALAQRGVVRPEHEVRREGTDRWLAASGLRGLFAEEKAQVVRAATSEGAPAKVGRYDVFLSYSNHDRETADAVVHELEARGIRCWMAPRDIVPGTTWSASIMAGLSESRVLVLVFSSHSNLSQQVLQEVERAVNKGLAIIPFLIEDVPIEPALELFIGSRHWLDASTRPLEKHLTALAESVGILLKRPQGAVSRPLTAAPVVPRERERRRVTLLVSLGLVVIAGCASAAWWSLRGRNESVSERPAQAVPASETQVESQVPVSESTPPAASTDTARMSSPAERDARERREVLLAASRPGQRWRVQARAGSAPVQVFELGFEEQMPGGESLLAVLRAPERPDVHVVYTGRCVEPTREDSSALAEHGAEALGWAWVLQPHESGNVAQASGRLPFGKERLVVTGGGSLAGLCGQFELVLESAGTTASIEENPRTAFLAALVPGARWRGTCSATGSAVTRVEAEVVRSVLEGGEVWLSLTDQDDPLQRVVCAGSLSNVPADSRGWPLAMKRATQSVSGAPLTKSSGDLRLRLDGTSLIGVCDDRVLVLVAHEANRKSTAERLVEALVPGTTFVGRVEARERASVGILWTMMASEREAGYLRATVGDQEEEALHFVLEGGLVPRTSAEFEAWPILLKRERRDGPKYREQCSLLGRYAVDLRLRPGEDGDLIGWCGEERITLEPRTERIDIPTSREGLQARLLGACAAGTVWEGKARTPNGPSIPLRLRFTECDELGTRIEAEVSSSRFPGRIARIEGKAALESSAIDGWPFSFKRTGRVGENDGKREYGQLLGYYEASCLLRLGLDGRLLGMANNDEWIELRREESATAMPRRSDVVQAAPEEFWSQLAEADSRIEAEDPVAARRVLRSAKDLLPEDSPYKLLIDLRDAQSTFMEGKRIKRTTEEAKARQIYKRARDEFEALSKSKIDVRDRQGVSTRALAQYYVCYLNGALWFTEKGERQYYLDKAEVALAKLENELSDECDATGKRLVDRARADLAAFRRGR